MYRSDRARSQRYGLCVDCPLRVFGRNERDRDADKGPRSIGLYIFIAFIAPNISECFRRPPTWCALSGGGGGILLCACEAVVELASWRAILKNSFFFW